MYNHFLGFLIFAKYVTWVFSFFYQFFFISCYSFILFFCCFFYFILSQRKGEPLSSCKQRSSRWTGICIWNRNMEIIKGGLWVSKQGYRFLMILECKFIRKFWIGQSFDFHIFNKVNWFQPESKIVCSNWSQWFQTEIELCIWFAFHCDQIIP